MANANRYTYSNNLAGNKLKFISGPQSNVDTLISTGGAIDGAFYLTSDTLRLYVGRTISDDSTTEGLDAKIIPVPVNGGILTVSNISDLTNLNGNAGEFYYISNENILAVYNGTEWVQINPDTNTHDTIEVSSVLISNGRSVTGTYSKPASYNPEMVYYTCNGTTFDLVTENNANDFSNYYEKGDSGSTLIYTLTIKQKKTVDNAETNLTDVVSYLVMPISSFAGTSAVGIENTPLATNSTTLQLTGDLADINHKVTLTGGNGISLSTTDNGIIIDGKTYSITSNVSTPNLGTIILQDNNGQSSDVNLYTGDHLQFNTTTNSQITLEHGDPTSAVTASTVSQTISASSTNLKIPSISIDNKGHVASVADNDIDLAQIIATNITSDTNGLIIILNKNGGNLATSTTAILYHTLNIDNQATATVMNQGYLGSFYSTTKVDQLIADNLKAINGLVYRGTVGQQDSKAGVTLPTTAVSIGDMYLVDNNVSSLTYAPSSSSTAIEVSVVPGDLLIAESANGEEDEDGFILSNNLYWTKISAGNIDTTYLLSTDSVNKTINFSDNHSEVLSTIKLSEGNKINVQVTTTGNYSIFTFNHAESGIISQSSTATSASFGPSSATSLAAGGSFTVPSITVDRYGHLTSGSDITLTLPESKNDNYSLVNLSSSDTYDTIIRLMKNNESFNTIALNGDTSGGVIVTATSNTINILHATPTISTTTTTATILDSDTMIELLSGISVDSYGHINNITTTTYTLPNRYRFMGSSVTTSTNSATNMTLYNMTHTLYQGNVSRGIVSYLSETLQMSSQTTTAVDGITNTTYSIDLVWESI